MLHVSGTKHERALASAYYKLQKSTYPRTPKNEFYGYLTTVEILALLQDGARLHHYSYYGSKEFFLKRKENGDSGPYQVTVTIPNDNLVKVRHYFTFLQHDGK